MADGRRPTVVPGARNEARRRAAILRRYVAIPAPSLSDDERFSEELGLSKDALYRLAKSWRLHGDETLLPGSQLRTSSADRQAALAAAADPDLAGVNPTRRPLIRRRIEALRYFLEIEAPTTDDERKAAASIDMSLESFQRLHRSWVLTRAPAALPGGSTPARTPKRRAPALSPDLERVIEDVIASLGPAASSTRVHREVADRCHRAGMRVPDQSTVYFRFVEARAKMVDEDAAPSFALDHAAIELPVRTQHGDQLPVLSVIMALPGGRIVAHALSLEPPSARSAAALLARALAEPASEGVTLPLQIGAPKGRDWDQLLQILEQGGVELAQAPTRSLRPGHFLTRTFGTRLGRLKLRPRIATRPASTPIKAMGRGSVSLSFQEASQVLDGIVAVLNSGRPTAKLAVVSVDKAKALAAALRRLGS